MPEYKKCHTYHVILAGVEYRAMNEAIDEWMQENRDAVVQFMMVVPYDHGMEAHIFFSDYPLDCPWHKDYKKG